MPFLPCPFARLALAAMLSIPLAPLADATDSDASARLSPGVRLHSAGFPPEAPKVATVSGGTGTDTFTIVALPDGRAAWEGALSPARVSPTTPEEVRLADFTAFATPGRYVLEVPGLPPSAPFEIRPGALNGSLRLVMLGFYGQRCGMAVELEHEGDVFAHEACHLDDGWLEHYAAGGADGHKDGVGGWHDAGDYGKYAVNSGFTHGLMLTAWEHFGEKLQDLELPIPERGGAVPDYLDEVRHNLEWMLKLQMPDGRVSHKLTRLNFSPMDTMPAEDDARRYFAPWGTAANANFVASLCQASRVYAPYDPEFAERCRTAAVRAWEAMQPVWRTVTPDLSAFTTGTYLRPAELDVQWAAIEMLLTAPEAIDQRTRERINRQLLADDFAFSVDWDWGQAKNLGLYAYLFAPTSPRAPEVVAKLERDLLLAADRLLANGASHAYGRSLRGNYWGVNGSIARSTMTLYAAHRVSGEEKYLDAAFDQVAYLYGRNPFGRSFVTGDGCRPPQHPHHRPSAADAVAAPWPGHLMGGPHPAEIDWFDEEGDYAHNENAINWDGALAYALAIFYEAGDDDRR